MNKYFKDQCKTIEKNKLFAKNTQNTVFCDFNFKIFSIQIGAKNQGENLSF